mgnify:CR=1 FL=1
MGLQREMQKEQGNAVYASRLQTQHPGVVALDLRSVIGFFSDVMSAIFLPLPKNGT